MVSRGTYHSIQGLRFLAALGVVAAHSAFYARVRLGSGAPDLDVLGSLGVGLFFAISGFIMTVLRDDRPAQGWRSFAWRRASRILPMYWIMTTFKLLTIVVAAEVVTTAVVDPGAVAASYLLLPSFNELGHIEPIWTVGWTLMFEMTFYAVVTIAIAARVDPLLLAAPLVLASGILSMVRPDDGSAWWFYANPVTLFFLAGMLVARWTRSGRSRTYPAVLLLLAVAHGVLAHRPVVSTVTFAALVGILVLAVAREPVVGPRLPRWLLVSGAASYSLYLTHPVVAQVVPELCARLGLARLPWPAVVACSVVLAAVVAPLVHRYVEAPLTRVLQRPRLPRLGIGSQAS